LELRIEKDSKHNFIAKILRLFDLFKFRFGVVDFERNLHHRQRKFEKLAPRKKQRNLRY
jgi:hypothetical protein